MQPGIVHLGIGAFHRAPQAVLADAVLWAGDLRWGITAASLRSPATRDALAPQDGLYALNLRGKADAYAVIGSVGRILVALARLRQAGPRRAMDGLGNTRLGVS